MTPYPGDRLFAKTLAAHDNTNKKMPPVEVEPTYPALERQGAADGLAGADTWVGQLCLQLSPRAAPLSTLWSLFQVVRRKRLEHGLKSNGNWRLLLSNVVTRLLVILGREPQFMCVHSC
jgi:hypothetical protein